MGSIELFNLHIGSSRPEELSDCQIGPYRVRMTDDYESQATKLYSKPSKSIDWAGNVTCHPGSSGTWEMTAIAEFNGTKSEKSILLSAEQFDSGLWDLCEILTFLTGRRVVSTERRARYSAIDYGERACLAVETFRAASVAWNNRQSLRDKNIVQSLLLYNEALGYSSLPVIGLLHNTALDILLHECSPGRGKICKSVRKRLRRSIGEVIRSCDSLTDEQKSAYEALVGGRIDQGPDSLTDKLKSLLAAYGLLRGLCDSTIKKKIGYINGVRNRLVHGGQLPTYTGLSQEKSDVLSANIIWGIVPELIRLVIGGVFGFGPNTPGSLSQDVRDLRRFLESGIWREWNLEEQSWEEYYQSLESYWT